MTSNIGSHLIQEAFEGVDENNIDEAVSKSQVEVMALLKQTIRPEFLNRIDETIMFKPLEQNEIVGIVKLQLNLLKKKLKEQSVTLDFTQEAIEHLVKTGFDPQFGARPLKRLIQKEIVNQLSKKILSGEVDRNKNVMVDVFDGVVVFRND